MLAKKSQINEAQAITPLRLVEKSSVKTGAECLAEIRQKLNSKSRNPAYIYDCLLTDKQRAALCFTAGLSRIDHEVTFVNLNADSRKSIKNAIVSLGQVAAMFRDANAMETSKFLYAEEY